MTKINNEKFFTKYRDVFGSLTQSQVDGLNYLLEKFNESDVFDSKAKIAYALATIKHETGNTYSPIEERGGYNYFRYLIGKLGIINLEEANLFKGRGYVQITGKVNYKNFSEILGIDLYNNPKLTLIKENAFKIMEVGMSKGKFTGKKLTDYFNGDTYYFGVKKVNGKKSSPRQMINGFDCAEMIGDYADKFFSIIEFE